jgi:hypothetical protein
MALAKGWAVTSANASALVRAMFFKCWARPSPNLKHVFILWGVSSAPRAGSMGAGARCYVFRKGFGSGHALAKVLAKGWAVASAMAFAVVLAVALTGQ